jgi:galactose oxidase
MMFIRSTLVLGSALVLAAGSLHPTAAQALPVAIPQAADPWFVVPAIPATAPAQGMWSPVFSWPIVALHLTVLPNGDILSFGTPVSQAVQEGRILDRWNPSVPNSHLTLPNSQNVNSFCAAGILLNSGSLLVSGGNTPR